jgi:hypothetical protein
MTAQQPSCLDIIDRAGVIGEYLNLLLRKAWEDLEEVDYPQDAAIGSLHSCINLALELVAELNSLDSDPAAANCRN